MEGHARQYDRVPHDCAELPTADERRDRKSVWGCYGVSIHCTVSWWQVYNDELIMCHGVCTGYQCQMSTGPLRRIAVLRVSDVYILRKCSSTVHHSIRPSSGWHSPPGIRSVGSSAVLVLSVSVHLVLRCQRKFQSRMSHKLICLCLTDGAIVKFCEKLFCGFYVILSCRSNLVPIWFSPCRYMFIRSIFECLHNISPFDTGTITAITSTENVPSGSITRYVLYNYLNYCGSILLYFAEYLQLKFKWRQSNHGFNEQAFSWHFTN